jgi:hypothetical protein
MGKKSISTVITIIALIFPVSFLIGLLDKKIAMPAMFMALAVQNIFNGLYIIEKEKRKTRKATIGLGIFFFLFSLIVVLPTELGMY